MNEHDTNIQRVVSSEVIRDPETLKFVDRELPTRTVKLRGPARRGMSKAPAGTIPGSFYFSGSNQPNALGTYSFRITRIDANAGTRGITFMIRHSRIGTLFANTFETGGGRRPLHLQGRPEAPLISVGPGTLIWQWIGTGGQASIGSYHMVSAFIEGIPG